jgi:Sperm-tail PG-rich repeat
MAPNTKTTLGGSGKVEGGVATLNKGDTFLPKRTIIEAFDKTSYFIHPPEIGFGSGTRPPLMEPTPGPGPGAYPIKTTMGKLPESHITSPCAFTLKGREKFGDPNAKALSKTSANEPGPAAYDITDKFVSGSNPRKSGFPKAVIPRDKAALGPGPGSYKPMYSMGKQVLSTKHAAVVPGFSHAARPSMEIKGGAEVGPGEYKQGPAACEPQVDSRRPTCGMIKFGAFFETPVCFSRHV